MNRLALLRYERGLTLSQVAEGAGVHIRTLNKAEDGDTPTAPVAKRLADFYEVSVAEVLGVGEAA